MQPANSMGISLPNDTIFCAFSSALPVPFSLLFFSSTSSLARRLYIFSVVYFHSKFGFFSYSLSSFVLPGRQIFSTNFIPSTFFIFFVFPYFFSLSLSRRFSIKDLILYTNSPNKTLIFFSFFSFLRRILLLCLSSVAATLVIAYMSLCTNVCKCVLRNSCQFGPPFWLQYILG